jgi:hypothetical protein
VPDLTSLPGAPWPSKSPRQDHAVLAWLVVDADLPCSVRGLLMDTLVAWAPLMGERLFPTEPEAGVDADLRQVLEGMRWRVDAQAAEACWADKVVLDECAAGSAWRCRRCAHLPLVCRGLGQREGEAARVAGPLIGRCGGASSTLTGACVTAVDTAADAASARRRCSLAS